MRLIDADALKKEMNCACPDDWEYVLDDMPTIEADPVRHGKWGEQWTTRGESMKEIELLFGKCSNCGQWHVALQVTFPYFSKYCPNCGAKMDKE